MLRGIYLIILLFVTSTVIAQRCFETIDGKGLSLFSPFLKTSPRYKEKVPGGAFGDSSSVRVCNNKKRRAVTTVFVVQDGEPIFAAHAGTVFLYTSVSTLEDNQSNDALWIDGDSLTTNYIGLKPVVQTGQYAYAGQLIGRVYKESYGALFGFAIRRSRPVNPFQKRGFLPSVEDKVNSCTCNGDPVWPEYFVDPASPFINFDRYNYHSPETSLKVNIEPGGVGDWSFDNGSTWLSGGDEITGLPFGYYKVIFTDKYGYVSPALIQIRSTNTSKHFETTVKYLPDYTILKKPGALLQREHDQLMMESKLGLALDSVRGMVNVADRSDILRNNVIDSLNKRFTKIENFQRETLFIARLFKYILPVLSLAVVFMGILFFQNNKIRRQKKYLENLQKEQHHRVHNSLGLVSSLLNKYKDNIDPEKMANVDNSIIAISTVHRQLYKGNNLEKVDFQPIAENIAKSLLLQRGQDHEVRIEIDAKIHIPQKKSTTLALMFNELCTNSLKYAFDHSDDKRISLSANHDGENFLVIYKDNGTGYEMDFLRQKTPGFGRVLLNGLAHQLRAKIDFYNENGACCMIKVGS